MTNKTGIKWDTVLVLGHNFPTTMSVQINYGTSSWPTSATLNMDRGINCYYKYGADGVSTLPYILIETEGSTSQGYHEIGLIWVGEDANYNVIHKYLFN